MDIQDLEPIWTELASVSAEALRMTDGEKAAFIRNPVAKLVGLLPFLADCEEPKRTALAHLAVWVVANRGKAASTFDHKPADDRDPLARLAPIADFRGGDRTVIDAGMRRLALCMVAGYQRDMGKDHASGEYNPLNSGAWKADGLLSDLGAGAVESAPVDAVFGTDAALRAFWQD